MLPAAIMVPTVLGLVCVLGERRGYYTSAMALTLLSTWSIILLIPMTFATAAVIDAKDEERHRRHELLKASEARLSGILSIAADAIISVDNQQRITLFNAGRKKILGYSPSRGARAGRSKYLIPERRFRSAHNRNVTEFGKSLISARRMGEQQEIFARRKDW